MTSAQRTARENRIRELVAQGLPDALIAKRVGATRDKVRDIRTRLGLPRNDGHETLPEGMPRP
jgi:hypothetical protein